jgi:carboxyl-terminal processing protease
MSFSVRLLLACLGLLLAFGWAPLRAELPSSISTNRPVTPGPLDGRIAFIAAKILEQLHYTKQEFNDEVSSKLLDQYLATLDPQHIHFLQSDLKEF